MLKNSIILFSFNSDEITMNPLMLKRGGKWIVQKEWKWYILQINEAEQNTLFIS